MNRDLAALLMASIPENNKRLLLKFYTEEANVFSRDLALLRDEYAYDEFNEVQSRVYDGTMTLLGDGELNQTQTNAALAMYKVKYENQPLTTLKIGNGIGSLGDETIVDTDLESIIFDSQSKIQKIGTSGLSRNILLKTLLLPPKLKNVPVSLCSGCEILKELVLPKNVLQIEDSAFQNCPKLKTIAISSTITTFGDLIFDKCSALQKVTFPTGSSSLSKIGDSVFANCIALSEIDLSSCPITELGATMFSGCTALQKVTFPETLVECGKDTFLNALEIEYLKLHSDLFSSLALSFVPEPTTTAERQLVYIYASKDIYYIDRMTNPGLPELTLLPFLETRKGLIITISSIAGTVLLITGIIVGIVLWRRKKKLLLEKEKEKEIENTNNKE
jgi:hypothetical protein